MQLERCAVAAMCPGGRLCREHEELARLLEEARAGAPGARERFCGLLESHMAWEEEEFFPGLSGEDRLTRGHEEIRRLLQTDDLDRLAEVMACHAREEMRACGARLTLPRPIEDWTEGPAGGCGCAAPRSRRRTR